MGVSEKVEAAKAAQRFQPKEYREAVWTLMIAYGGAVPPKSQHYVYQNVVDYYGGTVNLDKNLTTEALSGIKEHGVDWDKLPDPAPDMGYGFNGTFASEDLQFQYLSGDLTLKNGTSYLWACEVKCEFGDLIRFLTLGITLDDAIEELEKRLEIAHSHYPFRSAIPHI